VAGYLIPPSKHKNVVKTFFHVVKKLSQRFYPTYLIQSISSTKPVGRKRLNPIYNYEFRWMKREVMCYCHLVLLAFKYLYSYIAYCR